MSATPDATHDNKQFLPFPTEFGNVADLTSRAFGTNIVATQLMMLDAVALASGNLIPIRTPDFREHISAINLAVINGGDALADGAMMSLINPIVGIIQDAMQFRNIRGPNLAHASFEDSIRQRQSLESKIEADCRELEQLGDPAVQTPEEIQIMADEVMGLNAGKPPGTLLRRKQLRETIDNARLELATVKRSIAQIRFESGVHILLKDIPWRDIPDKCGHSFDGNCAVLNFAPDVLKGLCTVQRRDLDLIAAAFHRTLTGASSPGNGSADSLPGTWAVLCGQKELWSRIFMRPAIEESGLLNDFLFVEAGSESGQCDPAAMVEMGKMTFWPDFLIELFQRRQCESSSLLVFNVEGAKQYLEFRRWCRTFSAGLSVDIRPYFANWPQFAVRIALGLGIMNNDVDAGTLPEIYLMAACEFAKSYAPVQAALLEKLISKDSKAVTTEREFQRMMDKLRKRGPLSRRGLARTYDRPDYARLGELLEIGIQRKLVDQRGPLFFATGVGVGAGGEPHVLNFTEPVTP